MKIKYDISLIQFMSMFERITHAKLKDCYIDKNTGILAFVVQPGQIGMAVGRKGINIQRLENAFKKKVKVVEFHPEKLKFIENMIMPLRVDEIYEDECEKSENSGDNSGNSVVILKSHDTKTKGLLIGRNASNLRNLEKNVRRFFEVGEIRVV